MLADIRTDIAHIRIRADLYAHGIANDGDEEPELISEQDETSDIGESGYELGGAIAIADTEESSDAHPEEGSSRARDVTVDDGGLEVYDPQACHKIAALERPARARNKAGFHDHLLKFGLFQRSPQSYRDFSDSPGMRSKSATTCNLSTNQYVGTPCSCQD